MLRKITAAVLLLIIILVAGCSSGGSSANQSDQPGVPDSQELQPVTVMLDWVPNTNHTGLYVARDKGWYAAEGLAVDIVEPTQGGTTQLVATGKAQFGVSYQEDVTLARASDVPVVSIAAVIQHNTSGFASPRDKGITSPRLMENKRYGGWGSPSEEAVLRAVVENDGGDFNKVQILNIGTADFFTAVERDVDFAWIYYGWTGIEAKQRGLDLNFLELREFEPALDYYTPVLIAGEQIIKDNPGLVEKFMRATAKGYQFAIDQPGEAARILLKNVPELDEQLVMESQKYLSPRYRDDAARWGEQNPRVWERYADWMYQNKLLPERIDTKRAFTNEFLPPAAGVES